MPRIDVAIVGAGAAGLAAGAALKRSNIDSILFDGDDRIGGTWARRYERLHLHTVRSFSGLPYHAIPKTNPRYVSKDAFAGYLEEYARRMELDVRLSHLVRKVQPVAGLWEVTTDEQAWSTHVVVIATGHYNRAVLPAWPGRDAYRGRLLHSVDFRTGADFAEQRVLVVGIGNSGAEIAADLVEQGASRVAVSVRTPPPIVPRELFGLLPTQIFGLAFARLPAPRLLDRLGATMRRMAVGDLRKHGLEPAQWGPFTARRPPVIDVGFLEQLKHGRIDVLPATERLTATGVVFADGSEQEFDAIVAATGFDTALADLLAAPGALDKRDMPNDASGQATSHPGLYFVGYEETIGGHLHRANREARQLAGEIERYLAEAATSA
jgi:putative flavoprotein involved in K+ transport